MSPHLQAQLGSVVAASGVIWLVAIASRQLSAAGIVIPTGPVELSATGILLWLHAKWRSSMRRV